MSKHVITWSHVAKTNSLSFRLPVIGGEVLSFSMQGKRQEWETKW